MQQKRPSLQASPSFLDLPTEILQHVIQSLIDLITTNERTGRQYLYYSKHHRQLQNLVRKHIWGLCLSSKTLKTVATPFLYRNVLLTKGNYLSTRQFKGIDISTGEPWPDRGITTLGLFLRTMIERPDLREHVYHLDCWFFLQDILDWEKQDIAKSILQDTHAWELEFLNECIKYASDENDDAILSHIGFGGHGNLENLGERAFTAILCLTPKLRTVAFPPPPANKWCRKSWDGFEYELDESEEVTWPFYGSSGYYDTMSNLIEKSLEDERLSPLILRNLEAVRFTLVPNFVPINSRAGHYSQDPDPTVPSTPGYTFQIDACLGILRGPKVVEFETDGDNGPKAVGALHQDAFANLKFQRAFLTTLGIFPEVVDYVSSHWPVRMLALRGAQAPSYENLSDESEEELNTLYIDLWNTGLGRLAKNITFLDIGSDFTGGPIRHLSCLHTFEAMEHLRIGLPLLNTNNGFITRPLQDILPPKLKTLAIDDRFAAEMYGMYSGSEDSWREGPKDKTAPRKYQRLMSSALHNFAGVCGKSHPDLHSISVFGRPPIDGPRYKDVIKTLELAGPKPGDVIPDFERVRDLFATSGVNLQEFFRNHELDNPFRDVLATGRPR